MNKYRLLFTIFFCLTAFAIRPAMAANSSLIKEVILVRGSLMPVCPFDGYNEQTKQRISDSNPYYDGMEYTTLHPNPMLNANDPGCKSFLYGQIELVPFGKEPTYIPTEYIYVFDDMVIREASVLLSKPAEFSDEKTIYKKVIKFKALDANTGETIELPQTLFWFRGTEVYGKIGDVSEGVVEINGKYYRHDGAQTFINHTVLWANPTGDTPLPFAISEASVSAVSASPHEDNSALYPNGVPWTKAPYGEVYKGWLPSTGLPLPYYGLSSPSGAFALELDLPESLASTAGLTATFKSCGNDDCTTRAFDEVMFVTDEKGNRLDMTMHETQVDLNTEYFRTTRKAYVLVGSKTSIPKDGLGFQFYFGPLR